MGKESDHVALKSYEGILKEEQEELQICKSYLRIDEAYHFLGASADAVATCKCHEKKFNRNKMLIYT